MPTLNLTINQQRYGSTTILQNIHQSYPCGQIHGVLGENGAGKTTLFHCMARLIPFEGEPMIPDNMSYGYLPAELYMYPMITGNEFLKFYITAKGHRFSVEEKEQLNQFFELPLDTYAERYSTGMLKKLYLLGLLLQHNDLLILDEPFNGLDFKSAAFITALIQDFRDSGHTIFMASHDMEHLFTYSDTLSVIKEKSLLFYPDPNAFSSIRQSIQEEALSKVKLLKVEKKRMAD